MSNRIIRKLRGEDEIVVSGSQGPQGDNHDSLSGEDDQELNSTKKPNRFELLLDTEENGGETTTKDEDDEEEVEEDENCKSVAGRSVNGAVESFRRNSANSDSLKRKRKKKKKPKKDKENSGNISVPQDDIEASIQEVNRILGPLHDMASELVEIVGPSKINLIRVENRHLNPENEMKRIFGSKVVQADQSSNSKHRRGKGRAALTRTWLLANPRNFHNIGRPSITMEISSRVGDLIYFDFVHSRQYQLIQFQFMDAVESYNPDNLVAILNQHPCHMDSLVQFSDVVKSEDVQMAGELIERALYCFESVFNTSFNVAAGNSRMSYKRPENRSFFITLFKHLSFIGQKGCYRTALEFCKVILSLDPGGDPLCVLLMMDFYALQSGQFDFLIQLNSEWESVKKLSLLPSFRFSTPLAMYLKSRYGADQLLAAEATRLLSEALVMFPTVLPQLLDKCNIEPDKEVTKCSYFFAGQAMPQAVQHLVALYVGRNHLLWKEKDILVWLETTVRGTIKKINEGDKATKGLMSEFAEMRKKYYNQGTPRNVLRHVILSGIKDASTTLPPDVTSSAIYGFDPLPPLDSMTSYTRPERRPVAGAAGGADGQHNLLGLFLRSWLPDFNAENGTDGGHAEGGHNDGLQPRPLRPAPPVAAAHGADGGTDFRRSVTSLMDAMRDLLNNVNVVDLPNDGDDDETEDDGGDRQID